MMVETQHAVFHSRSIPRRLIPRIWRQGRVFHSDVRQRMRDLVPASEETDFPIPVDGSIEMPKEPKPETKSLEQMKIAFLEDIQEQPDSGVAARYERLGLSVRQGQKLIEKLFEEGLIEQQWETTKVGRVRVIRPAEKDEVALSDANCSAS